MILLASKSKPKGKVKAVKGKVKKNKANNRKIPAKSSTIKKPLNKKAKPIKKSVRKIKKLATPPLNEEEFLSSPIEEVPDFDKNEEIAEEQKEPGKLKGFFSRIFKRNEMPKENAHEDMKVDSEIFDLEKQISELGGAFEKKRGKGISPLSSISTENNFNKKQQEIEEETEKFVEKKGLFSFFSKKPKSIEAEQEKEEPLKQDIQEMTEKKSKNFVKCQEMISKANSFLQNNDDYKAKDLYLKARELYLNLEFSEKKEIYRELMQLYNKISS